MVCVPTQERGNEIKERGNEIKSILVSSFPRSCVGMHICVMNILLPAVLKKLHKKQVSGAERRLREKLISALQIVFSESALTCFLEKNL